MAAHFPPYTKPTQEPTGAYRAPTKTDTVEAALRAACAALSVAADRLRDAQAASTQHGQARKLYDAQTARDVAWSAKRGDYTLPKWHPNYGKPRRDELPPNLAAAVSAPNCDGNNVSRIATPAEIDAIRPYLTAEELKGFGIGDVEPRHVLHAEALRQADEFERGDGETGV